MRGMKRGGWLLIAAALVVPGSSASGTGAEDTTECWRNFFRTQGIEEPLGEIATFSFLGHRLHVPGAYLWRGLPRTEMTVQGAVWLMAWGPQLAPVTVTQADEWRQATVKKKGLRRLGPQAPDPVSWRTGCAG